jgi:hypothetical protein
VFSEPPPPFVPFGLAHLGVLGGTLLLALALARWVRARPQGSGARALLYGLATLLLASSAGDSSDLS